jgi:hypothetical protein
MSRVRWLFALLGLAAAPVTALVAACSNDAIHCTAGLVLVDGLCVRPTHDAGPDATKDAPSMPETGPETGPDTGPDTGADTGPDGPPQGAPTFGGITSLSPASTTSLLVTWDPASDPATPASEMAYAIYVATTAKGEIFDASHAVQIAGQTWFMLSGLTTGKPYFVVVRAINKAGIEDINAIELSGTPQADTQPPSFNGPVTAVPLPGCQAGLSWTAATDDLTGGAGIRYIAYLADDADAGADAGAPLATSSYGATSLTVVVPAPTTTPYHKFQVVAVDASGNASTGGPIGDTNVPIQFSASIQTLLAVSCAPSCHTLNTTNKLTPIYDPGYAYQSLTGGDAGVAAKVCRPTNPFFCTLDAGDCPAWQGPDAGPFELVSPSNPGCSVLYEVLNQGKMPPGTAVQPVTHCDVVLVHDWIAQGAKNN